MESVVPRSGALFQQKSGRFQDCLGYTARLPPKAKNSAQWQSIAWNAQDLGSI